MRIVLVAESGQDAGEWLQAQPSLRGVDVVWVSPHAPGRARGLVADAVLITTAGAALPDEMLRPLLEQALPSVVSGGTRGR